MVPCRSGTRANTGVDRVAHTHTAPYAESVYVCVCVHVCTQAVEESRRGVLVASYIDALAQAQQRSAEQAQAKLRDLFR